ncbi:addiction module protein [Lunatimonas salinarum]|uniref:addiction module protein n=1 Tax=Lunatimonas salinarum TaxID=1774590 RepID=UPI001AE0D134|nr:addiction module protein [Lunatimonas salinarum]
MEDRGKMIEQLLKLPPMERASIAELLLKSLDDADPMLDAIWAEEVENRIDAYDQGNISSLSASEFFEKPTN